MKIRTARAEDADAIARLHARTWQVAYAHVFPAEALDGLGANLPRRSEFWRTAVEAPAPRSHTLVACDGELVGFAHVGPARDDDAHVGELYAIYVLPDAWGRGAGRALMAELLRRLRDEGFREAILWVLADNPRTRRFYELAGWRLDGAEKRETFLATEVTEVRYRIALAPP